MADSYVSKPVGPGAGVRLFVSYAHANEQHRRGLAPRLKILEKRGLISVWDDHAIAAGDAWRNEIEEQLRIAEIIVLLVTDDFLASDFIQNVELKQAFERHKTGDLRIIPIIVQHCLWKDSELAEIQVLPAGGKPLTAWGDQAEAYVQIAEQIRDAAIGIADRKKLHNVSERQRSQEIETEFLRMILPVVIPKEERGHLFNLVAKRTENYEGRSSLRRELRNLRSMQLIRMKNGKHMREIADGMKVDVADYVELTESGQFWMGRMKDIEGIDPERPLDD
jgi:hypothetical protein